MTLVGFIEYTYHHTGNTIDRFSLHHITIRPHCILICQKGLCFGMIHAIESHNDTKHVPRITPFLSNYFKKTGSIIFWDNKLY